MKMKISSKDFRVRPGEKVTLKEWPTMVKPFCKSKKKYQKLHAYEACLTATSTDHAPWYVVPADDKENARLIVSQVILDALNELEMAYPKTTAKRRRELQSIRKLLAK
jgi:polyphosphate kinase 2 (PPK2 family)